MVAYNFQKQFVKPIRSGAKTHTIRKNGKRRHSRPGEAMQLYFGLRTKHASKIINDPVCLFVRQIEIEVTEPGIVAIRVDGGFMVLVCFEDQLLAGGQEGKDDE